MVIEDFPEPLGKTQVGRPTCRAALVENALHEKRKELRLIFAAMEIAFAV
jgi:hypothetical protein